MLSIIGWISIRFKAGAEDEGLERGFSAKTGRIFLSGLIRSKREILFSWRYC